MPSRSLQRPTIRRSRLTPTISRSASCGSYEYYRHNGSGRQPGAALGVYADTGSGPTLLSGGEIAIGNLIVVTYEYSGAELWCRWVHLNFSGTSLFPAPSGSLTSNVTATSGTTLTASVLTGGGTGNAIITRTGTISGGYNDATDTAAAIVSAMPNASANSTFRFRYINTTTQTGTLTAGSGVTVNATNNTTANGATHDFIGVITNTGTPAVTIYG